MARGAVVVILSDGWERGDPALVGREMAAPGAGSPTGSCGSTRGRRRAGFAPRAGGHGGGAPALRRARQRPHLAALDEVVEAIGAPAPLDAPPLTRWRRRSREREDEEPWASATPVPGSSVAMPSGYGPSRGRTTPGWSLA